MKTSSVSGAALQGRARLRPAWALAPSVPLLRRERGERQSLAGGRLGHLPRLAGGRL